MANYGTKINIYGSRKYAQSGIKRERVKDKITKIPYNYRIVKKKHPIYPKRFGYIVYASKRRKK